MKNAEFLRSVWINHIEHGAMLNNGKHSHKANAGSHRHSLCATSSPGRSSVESKSAYNVMPCTCHGGNTYVIERCTHSITRGTLYIELHFTRWSSHHRHTYSSSAIWISCCAFSCFKRSQSSASSPWEDGTGIYTYMDHMTLVTGTHVCSSRYKQ